jgi:GNAT superfamily N-acetyltransferase
MSTTNNSTITPDTVAKPKHGLDDIIIRRAHLFEGGRIGVIAARTYFDTPLSCFISPSKSHYYSDYEEGFKHRAQARLFQPNNVSFVACERKNPNLAIAYAQFQRLGNDDGYKAVVKQRDTYLLRFLATFWTYWTKFVVFLHGGDRSLNPEALKVFESYGDLEDRKHWDHRPNRWEAQSVVVLEEFQGRGIGQKLMAKVKEFAEKDQVVVGLHASEPGRLMYLRAGFDFLDNYQMVVEGDKGGGVMLYTPKSLQAKQQ